MAYAIKDMNTNKFYRQKVNIKSGWYSSNIDRSRLFTSIKQAQQTIDKGNHHVIYPGNRILRVVKVSIVEVWR